MKVGLGSDSRVHTSSLHCRVLSTGLQEEGAVTRTVTSHVFNDSTTQLVFVQPKLVSVFVSFRP